MEKVQALQSAQAQARSPPKIDPAVADAVAAAASSSPGPLGGAAVSEAMAAKARAAAEAQVAAATAAAKAAAEARLAAAAKGGPFDVGDEANVEPVGVPASGEDEEDAMLAAAIAASLQTSDPSTDQPAAPEYVAEKEQLVAMGFADDSANMLALQNTSGDVQRALELLLA